MSRPENSAKIWSSCVYLHEELLSLCLRRRNGLLVLLSVVALLSVTYYLTYGTTNPTTAGMQKQFKARRPYLASGVQNIEMTGSSNTSAAGNAELHTSTQGESTYRQSATPVQGESTYRQSATLHVVQGESTYSQSATQHVVQGESTYSQSSTQVQGESTYSQSATQHVVQGESTYSQSATQVQGESPYRQSATKVQVLALSANVPTVPEPEENEKVSPQHYRGYVVAIKIWEQMIMSLHNLADLQCWAARHKLSVVEHFFKHSRLSFTFEDKPSSNTTLLRMGDMFDMEAWSQYSKDTNIPPLVKPEAFSVALSQVNTTWNIILVQVVYKGSSAMCRFTWTKGQQMVAGLSGGRVVRRVCINAPKHRYVTYMDRAIFRNSDAKNTIVIFSEWRGIGVGSRFKIKLDCSRTRKYLCRNKPSPQVTKDVETYVRKYHGGFGEYIAVMARMEKCTSKYMTMKGSTLKRVLKGRIVQTIAKWNSMKRSTSTQNTFLTYDYGTFGSDTFKSHSYYGAKGELEKLHKTVYQGRNMTLEAWENSFASVATFSDNGYIALLQLEIAAQAKCLLLVGSRSNFLSYAIITHKRIHGQDSCIVTIDKPQRNIC